MEVSGEVADLLVREGLQVAEMAARLSGKGVDKVRRPLIIQYSALRRYLSC